MPFPVSKSKHFFANYIVHTYIIFEWSFRGPISSMSLLEYCEDLVPNARTKKAMKWLEKCLWKMESKKFRPKVVTE